MGLNYGSEYFLGEFKEGSVITSAESLGLEYIFFDFGDLLIKLLLLELLLNFL